MKFKYVSDNIIVCPNFVPPHIEQQLRIELMNNRGNFSAPMWFSSDRKYKYNQMFCDSQILCHEID